VTVGGGGGNIKAMIIHMVATVGGGSVGVIDL